MTAKEALKILHEPDRIVVTIIKENTPDATKYNDDSMTALQMAISALEKQIPKKSCSTSSFFHYKCPSCGNPFPINWKYCDNCGQALDWEET